jgi:superfamily II DNA/RNA helicase
MENNLLGRLEAELLAEIPDWGALKRAAQASRNGNASPDSVNGGIFERLAASIEVLEQSPSTAGIADVVALLRQVIRGCGELRMTPLFWQCIRQQAERTGLVGMAQDDAVVVIARDWSPDWLSNTSSIDRIVPRRREPPGVGDGMLSAMYSSWRTYRSDAQKAAVDAWVFAAPGTTTLVTLPTGAGKSLCMLLPAWFDSHGGRVGRGTTLVVVPTVALALDQERQAQRFFTGSAKPVSRTGLTNETERIEIEAGLRAGRIPILYTSPESLLQSRLYDVCLDAAEKGLITRFVLDEAHLVETWGAQFRPEFQLLAAYRREMLARSGGALRTLLLSATISEDSRELLENLYCEPGRLVTVQANRLRPEIGYWLNFSGYASQRRSRVLEAMHYLPRPIILYVTRPDQAEDWAARLRAEGYRRLATFTGETPDDERLALIRRWDRNEIDIMVATSAFGLGVDKGDVRSIVHATLPENINRFYQEVGRGGRDGYSAVSLLCVSAEDDIELAYALNPKWITVEKGYPRWKAMVDALQPHPERGDTYLMNRDALPATLRHKETSERNREWNNHLLLLLQRAGVLDIVDAPQPDFSSEDAACAWVTVKLRDRRILDDAMLFRERVEAFREVEKRTSTAAMHDLLDLVKQYSEGTAEECLADELAQVYMQVQRACGGCPACRAHDEPAYGGDQLEFQTDYSQELANTVDIGRPVAPELRDKLGAWRALNVVWTDTSGPDSLNNALDLLPDLVRLGIQQLIVADELLADGDWSGKLSAELARPDAERAAGFHRVIPASWLSADSPLFPLPTIVVFPNADRDADRLYCAIQSKLRDGLVLPAQINVIRAGLHLASEGKAFIQHVDGLTEPVDRLRALLRRAQKPVAFF